MYTFEAAAPNILVGFPFGWLEDFKTVVHPLDRRFVPERKKWMVTRSGFDSLCALRAEDLAPLPLDVLDLAFPARKPTRDRRPRSVLGDPKPAAGNRWHTGR